MGLRERGRIIGCYSGGVVLWNKALLRLIEKRDEEGAKTGLMKNIKRECPN